MNASGRLKKGILFAILLLFATRFFSLLLNLKHNFGELVRPDLNFPEHGYWLSALAFLILFVRQYVSLRKLPLEFQLKNALIYPIVFSIVALVNIRLGKELLIYRLFRNEVSFDDLQAVLQLDLFFQTPYIFWAWLWFAFSFHLLKRLKQERLIDLLWVLPALQFSFVTSNFHLIFIYVILANVLIFQHCKTPLSPRSLHWFIGISFAAALTFIYQTAMIYSITIQIAMLLLLISWLTAHFYLKFCFNFAARSGLENPVTRYSWFYLLFFCPMLTRTISELPMGRALFNFWFLISSMSYSFISISHIVSISLLAVFIGLAVRKLEKPAFYLMLSGVLLFYTVNALVFYFMGQNLDFNAIDWVWSLSNLEKMFFETAVRTVDARMFAGFLLLPLFLFTTHKAVSCSPNGFFNRNFKPLAIFLLVASTLSYPGIRLTVMPVSGTEDPIKFFVSSIPFFKNYFDPLPDAHELQQKLAQTGFDFNKTTALFLEQQRKLPAVKPANLILITLESTGTQYLSLFGCPDKTTPKLESIKDRLEIFPFYFSTFAESANAEFSLYTSIFPSSFHVFRFRPTLICNSLIEILKAAGFDCSLFFSIYSSNTGIGSFFLQRGPDRMYDANTMPGISKDDAWIWGAKEHFVVDRVIEHLETRKASDQPFFIYYRSAFPHAPFDPVSGHPAVFASHNQDIIGRFKDCVSYMDTQIFRIIKALEHTRLNENTYVIITADHVTSLGENTHIGHGWNCDPRLTNVPFIIVRPKATGFKINPRPGSHVDMMPTALNLLGVRSPLPVMIQGMDLNSELPPRKIFLASFNHLALLDESNTYFWFFKEIQSMKVLQCRLDGSAPHFDPVEPVDVGKVNNAARTLLALEKLQRILIMNFEHYYEKFAQSP